MATNQQTEVVAPAKPGKSKLMLIIGIVLIAALGGGGYFLFFRHPAPSADEKSADGKTHAGKEASSSTEPLYLALDPAFVVNFQDDTTIRFLQVNVQLMSHEKAAIEAAKAADPVLRNALIMLFSSQSYDVLSKREGKEQLLADCLAEVQKIVSERLGRPGIEAVYFVGFVMQ